MRQFTIKNSGIESARLHIFHMHKFGIHKFVGIPILLEYTYANLNIYYTFGIYIRKSGVHIYANLDYIFRITYQANLDLYLEYTNKNLDF